jgi:hypothetical protein
MKNEEVSDQLYDAMETTAIYQKLSVKVDNLALTDKIDNAIKGKCCSCYNSHAVFIRTVVIIICCTTLLSATHYEGAKAVVKDFNSPLITLKEGDMRRAFRIKAVRRC